MLLWWDDTSEFGLVLEPATRARETLATIKRLQSATSLRQLQRAELADWVADYIAGCAADAAQGLLDDRWDYLDHRDVLMNLMPVPWAADSVTEWLDRRLLESHAAIGGASPGGNIDGYAVRDQEAFFASLRRLGHSLERRPGLLDRYFELI
jgi:hypothetical protein